MQLEALLLTAVVAASANAQCTVGDVASSLTSALAAIQSDSQDTADKVNAFEQADGLLAALAIQNGYGSIVNDVSAANAAASAMPSGAPACDQSAVSTGFNDMAGPVKALLQALIDKYSDLSGVGVGGIVQSDLTGLQPSVIELESYALEKLDCTIAAAMYPEMDSINALFGSALSVYSATSQQAPAAPSCTVESSSAAPISSAASSAAEPSAAASSAAEPSAAASSAAEPSAAASSAAESSAAASSAAESSAAASSAMASSAASAAAPSSQAPSSAATATSNGNITTTINATSTVTVCPTCTDKTVVSTDVVTVCPTCTEKPASNVNVTVTDTVTDCPSSTEPATKVPVSVEVTKTVTDCPSSTETKPVTHAPVSVEVTETVTDCPSSTVKAVTSAPVEAPVTHKVIKTATVTSCPPSSAIYHNSTAVSSSAVKPTVSSSKPAVVPVSGTTAAVVQANGAGSLRVYLAAPAIALALSLFA